MFSFGLKFTLMLLLAFGFGAMLLSAELPYEPWKESADPVAKLWQRVSTGEVKLVTTDEKSFLQQVLRELKVPVESQVLVFSKTSLQNALIGPMTPRAVYFSEDVYAGWVQGGSIELIGIDPVDGPHFYTLSYPFKKAARPQLATQENCLSCHEGSRTGGVRGMLVRSVYVDDNGQPLLRHGSFLSGQESPLAERWGGWYVTGKHGEERHMGNVIAQETETDVTLDREKGANVTSLEPFIATEPYLTNTSDIVALMVLEHQVVMQNKITEAGKSVREAMARQHDLQVAFKEPVNDTPQGSALSVINGQVDRLLEHMLFIEEYPLKDNGIEGSLAFQEAFQLDRRESKDGRSLKDFQLRTRLFKHRCSYMIYSKAFDALPAAFKEKFYERLWKVLSGQEKTEDFASLSESERQYIRDILLATIKDLPGYWH
ncbi:hypothetical protein BH11VER1_BH11VER1_26370 [soil metagenome]